MKKYILSLKKYKNQLLATLCVSILSISHGSLLGWNSPSILQLKSENSPLSTGSITVDEASWLGSIYPIGALIGNAAFGFMAKSFGRKTAINVLAIPQLIFWLLILFGDNIYYLYIARFLHGAAAGGIFVIVPVYTTEISSKEIRGGLSSSFVLAINIGTLIGFTICGNLPYNIVPYVFIALPVLFFVSIFSFPETPQHLFINGDEAKSKESLGFYRNLKKDSPELNEIFEEMKINLNSNVKKEGLKISDLWSQENRKGVIQSIIMNFTYIASGGFIIINYVGIVFEQTGAHLDPNTSTIIFAVVQIVAAYISILLGNRIKRRTLMMISSGGGSVGLLTTGIFAELVKYYPELKVHSWIPVTSLCFAMFMLTVGVMTYTFTVIAETLNQKIKDIGMALINIASNILCFVLLKVFPILMEEFGLISVMALCGGICIFEFIYCGLYLIETSTKLI